jgi:sulfur relay (sulfurtransferase) complex TusBCD TusD component (DsrE family)|tara:strand:- start:257 stop:430 length:174 start_codon:yes stop_codon:yes gene_type:complete
MNSEEKIKKALQLLDELLTKYEKEILYYEDGTVKGNFHMTNLEVVQQITEIKKVLIS